MKTYAMVMPALVVAAVLLTAAAGCKTNKEEVVLIDKPTPAGTTAEPVPAASMDVVEPYRPASAAAPAPTVSAGPAAVSADVAPAFERALEKAGNPRIALFVNRDFSDDVRDWGSNTRVKQGVVTTTTTDEGPKTTASTAVTAVERRNDGDRAQFEEQWTWRFEEGLYGPLVEAGANMIDRAMVMRLVAADEQPDALGDISVKRVETNALKGHADLLVEVLISARKDEKLGYVFNVKATSIEDGRILVRRSSAQWPAPRRAQARGDWEATADGMERVGAPDPERMAVYVAEDIMDGLAKRL